MSKKVATRLKKEFGRFNWSIFGLLFFLLLLDAGAIYLLSWFLDGTFNDWLPTLFISAFFLVASGLIIILLADRLNNRVQTLTKDAMEDELGHLRAANDRARSLQAMASTLRATLSFERVVEAALDVCSLSLEEMGIASRTLVGAVLLYENGKLKPVATRKFLPQDMGQRVEGKQGIIGKALRQAEPAATNDPKADPELRYLATFQTCKTAVCVPLRAGFQIFGAMILGTQVPVDFEKEHLDLFNSVADHAVIALQNAKLYQDLKAEKQRIIEADEDARKELARDLHDGPTQSIAAIAMRVNFIRSLIQRNPQQALTELEKVESLARETSKEIRGMLFTLRPLVLETEGLIPAIETVVNRLRETDGLHIRMVGGEVGEVLDDHAQSVVFSIVEEALGNARKYSEAGLIEVRFWRESDLFVAQVVDDGVGFDVKSVNANYSSRGSLGMVNMRERAERIDGSLRVESTPGEGTTITLVVPLDKHGRSRSNGRRDGQRVPVNRR